TRWPRDWSSDVCSSDLIGLAYHNHLSTYGYFPTDGGRWWDPADGPISAKSAVSPPALDLTTQLAGFQFQILPYIEQENLWRLSRSEERRVGKEWRCRGG